MLETNVKVIVNLYCKEKLMCVKKKRVQLYVHWSGVEVVIAWVCVLFSFMWHMNVVKILLGNGHWQSSQCMFFRNREYFLGFIFLKEA
jgi:hypothetical protein